MEFFRKRTASKTSTTSRFSSRSSFVSSQLLTFQSELVSFGQLIKEIPCPSIGSLYGMWTEEVSGTPVVSLMIPPGRDSVRTHSSFQADTNYEKTINNIMRAHGLSLIGEWAYLNGPKMANRLLRSNLKTRFVRLVVRLDAGVASYEWSVLHDETSTKLNVRYLEGESLREVMARNDDDRLNLGAELSMSSSILSKFWFETPNNEIIKEFWYYLQHLKTSFRKGKKGILEIDCCGPDSQSISLVFPSRFVQNRQFLRRYYDGNLDHDEGITLTYSPGMDLISSVFGGAQLFSEFELFHKRERERE